MPVPLTEIAAEFSPICNPMGTLTDSRGNSPVVAPVSRTAPTFAGNSPSGNNTLLAVLPKKEPPIANRALLPNISPLGLIKNKFAVPFARIKPSILDRLFPVTRVRIF